MKYLASLLFGLLSVTVSAQCSLTGLQANYCQSDSADSLVATCSAGGDIVFSGSGVNANGIFNPANADTGWVAIVVYADYVLDTGETFNPISGSGTSVSLSDDQVSSGLNIGFPFRFYGNEYTQFYISSNGFITFDPDASSSNYNGCCSGQSLPSTTDPNDLIAFAWEDLNPPLGGSITYFTSGTSPNQICCINFTNIQHYGGGNPVTTQLQLHEGCGRIEIHTTSMPTDGGDHTMGIENDGGTGAEVYPGRNATSWSASSEMVGWEPSCPDTFYTYVSPGPSVMVMADSNLCADDSSGTALAMASGTSPFTYVWPNGQTTAAATGLPSGTGVITVTDGAGCSSETSYYVYSPQALSASFSSQNSTCDNGSDGSATVTVAGGVASYSYVWASGATTTTATGLAPGNHDITVTDANGCDKDFSTTVGFDNEAPDVDLGDDRNICPGKTIALIAPLGFDAYLWDNGSTDHTILVTQGGTYSVTVTSAEGCEGSDEIEVIEIVPVAVDLGPNVTDFAPVVLDAGSSFTSYMWSTGSQASSISVFSEGKYSVQVVDSNDCSTSDTIKVNIIPLGIGSVTENGLSAFPNPVKEILNLKIEETITDAELKLFDESGRLVLSQTESINAGELNMIDVSLLPAGHYVIRIFGGQEQFEQSIVIQ